MAIVAKFFECHGCHPCSAPKSPTYTVQIDRSSFMEDGNYARLGDVSPELEEHSGSAVLTERESRKEQDCLDMAQVAECFEREQLELKREEQERLEQKRLEAEHMEQERMEQERAEQKRVERGAEVQAQLARREKDTAREQARRAKELADAAAVSTYLRQHHYSGVNAMRTRKFKSKYPLHTAVKRSDAGMIRLLLAAGADAELKNSAGETPSELADRLYKDDEQARKVIQKAFSS